MDINRNTVADRNSSRYDKIVFIRAKRMEVSVTSIGKRNYHNLPGTFLFLYGSKAL